MINLGKQISKFILVVILVPALRGACHRLESAQEFSICSPEGWYHNQLPSGALFLCSRAQGNCTISGGGLPRAGSGSVSIVRQDRERKNERSLIELARRVLHDPKFQSQITRTQTEAGELDQILVRKDFTLGGIGENPVQQLFCFAELGGRRFLVSLSYNKGDRDAIKYEDVFRSILLSIRLK